MTFWVSQRGRQEYFLHEGETQRINDVLFNFNEEQIPEAVNILQRNDSLLFNANRVFTQTLMATQTRDTLYPKSSYYPLRLRALYTDGLNSFVLGDFNTQGSVTIKSESAKVKAESVTALKAKVSVNGKTDTLYIYGSKGMHGRPTVASLDGFEVAISYGSKHINLPFSIKLYDFIMERYPGTNSAVSYASEVQLIDNRENLKEDNRIYMNHILTHDGYRFFQSSFDNDEQGTYLSVNHDFWGSWISYFGYALLTVGFIMTLLSKNTRFYQISQSLKKLREQSAIATSVVLFFVMTISIDSSAQKVINPINEDHIIDSDHAKAFSRLIVQDQNGRMKPAHTLTREVMRKLSRKESLNGLNADQILLGMFANAEDWIGVDMIHVGKHEKILQLLNTAKSTVSYNDFFYRKRSVLVSG